MKDKGFVIIGGDAAGMSAATTIRRSLPEAEITVYEHTDYFSYAQCGLPYVISGEVASTEKLVARTLESFQQKYKINALDKHQVISINRDLKELKVKNLHTGETFTDNYHRLLIATGANPVLPKWPGSNLQGVVTLKTIPDAHHLMHLLEHSQNVVIIGGGAAGLELAEACRVQKKVVTLIDLLPQVAGIFDMDMAKLVQEELTRNGVIVYLEEEVVEFRGEQGHVTGVITNNRELAADVVIVAIGVKPNSELAEKCSLELGIKNAIQVNEFLQTSDPSIWAAGDCALHYNRIKDKADYIPLGTTANKQGQLAGFNMAGEKRAFQGVLGTGILKVFDLGLARTGLTEREAKQYNIPYEVISVLTTNHASYYPGAKSLNIKLVFQKDSGLLLGGQAIGEHGTDKFIDVLATAMYNKMTIRQLEDLDLAYAPPFSTAWPPLQQAARLQRMKKA